MREKKREAMDEENSATVPRSLQKAGVKASCRNDHYPVFAPHVLQDMK